MGVSGIPSLNVTEPHGTRIPFASLATEQLCSVQVAQLAERLADNQYVVGSSPTLYAFYGEAKRRATNGHKGPLTPETMG